MDNLLTAWPLLRPAVERAPHVVLTCDYDGTVTPIVALPEQAHLSKDARSVLRAIALDRHYSVFLLSGRALAELRLLAGLEGVIYGGNHGLEIEGPGIRFTEPRSACLRPVLAHLAQALREAVAGIGGAFVEDKGLTLSVHYRQVETDRVARIRDLCERLLDTEAIRAKVVMSEGKKVYELRPAVPWGKGHALDLVLDRVRQRLGGREPLPLYLGDDWTDEDAFRVATQRGGIAVLVGAPGASSDSQYYLNTPKEVMTFLRLLA